MTCAVNNLCGRNPHTLSLRTPFSRFIKKKSNKIAQNLTDDKQFVSYIHSYITFSRKFQYQSKRGTVPYVIYHISLGSIRESVNDSIKFHTRI